MMTLKFYISLFLFLLVSPSFNSQTPRQLSETIYSCLKSKDYVTIDGLFDTTGLAKFTAYSYKEFYKKELQELGTPKKLITIHEEHAGNKIRTALALEFKTEKNLLIVLFSENKKIESLAFNPYTEEPFYQLKGYTGFSEVTDLMSEVKTRDGLTLSANVAFGDTSKQKSPLVIFVHGSGPSDRDATLGPNKIFRDLAQGLAQQGIVSLRYDKRTFAYKFNSKLMNDSMTIYEETINDAIDAVKVAKQFTFIDTTRIYIIGHSQGAMCAPKMAEMCPQIKGIVMLAAPARNMLDLMPDQVEYMARLDDSISNAEQMQLTSIKWMIDKIKSPNLSYKTPKGLLLGASPKYWKSILNYQQIETAKGLTLPILIMNGERDYQVSMKEFNLWRSSLSANKNVQFISYPKLNHLFLEGEGKPNPDEYELPGHIPQEVIDDLAKFIK